MVTPYITFNGNCKEAMIFYQEVFKAEPKASIPYGDYIPDDTE